MILYCHSKWMHYATYKSLVFCLVNSFGLILETAEEMLTLELQHQIRSGFEDSCTN